VVAAQEVAGASAEGAAVAAGWEAIVPEPDPEGSAYAPVAEQRQFIRQEYPAST